MPISCGVLADIALSLLAKTLTLPAIETSEGTEQFSGVTEYCHSSRFGLDCRQVDARTVHPPSPHLDCWRHQLGELE
jgi:hypothetical protein